MTRASLSGYVPMGDVAASEFNATKYTGVCKPTTFAALAIFKGLQAQLNRVAAVTGSKPIMIDGDIGPGTVGLYAAVKGALVEFATTMADSNRLGIATQLKGATSCIQIATIADVITKVAKTYADSKNAPASVPGPAPVKLPTIITPSGNEVAVSSSMALTAKIFGRPLSTIEMLAVAAVGGGVGYMLYKSRKKRRK